MPDPLSRRSVLGLLGAASAGSLIGCTDDREAPPARVIEPEAMPALQGFAWPQTVTSELVLHVSTIWPGFALEIYTLGAAERVAAFGPFDGASLARGQSDAAWQWPELRIPIALPPGLYIGALRACDETGAIVDAPPSLATANGEAKILFIVRGAPTAAILYKLPLFTYQAYNETGGASLYGVWDKVQVTMRRPGGGTGHTRTGDDVWQLFADGLTDSFGAPGDRQWNTFEHWDAKMIRWLLARGTALDFCTDWDLHVDPDLLSGYRLLVNAGHDEYWSSAMRDQVEDFLAAGGNAAWFGGNTAFWKVDVDERSALITCDKTYNFTDHWNLQGRPENAMTGMSMRAAGYTSRPRAPLGYTVLAPQAWVFAATGIAAGEDIGADAGVVGYECDGAPIDAELALTFADETPLNFQALARCVLPTQPSQDGWLGAVPGAAMIGLFARRGTVFNAGTTDWARVLAAGDADIVTITGNVIDRLRAHQLRHDIVGRVAPPQPTTAPPPPPPIAGMFDQPIYTWVATDEGFVVATTDGNVYRVFGSPPVFDVLPFISGGRGRPVPVLTARPDGVTAINADGYVHELSWTL
jgi:hypothetical protein